MPLQLDIATLVLMFITLAVTSFIVMFLIWRINRDMPGILCWMLATLLNITSAVATLLQAISGGTNNVWMPLLSNSVSLLANVLVVQGALLFRGYSSARSRQLLILLTACFIIISWLYRLDSVTRDAAHDTFILALQFTAGLVLIWQTGSRQELQANLLAAVSCMLIAVLISWQLLLALAGNDSLTSESASQASQWYLFAGANLHVAWIFGLSVACYFRSRQQVMSLAREDSLTRLPNRRWIDEKLSQTLAEAQRSGEKFALIMLDINDFKLVNDKHGHSAGDKVLTELARRLGQAVRSADFAGRLGGDEFIILARHIETQDLLAQLVARLRQQLNGSMTLENNTIDVRVSIGSAVFSDHGETADVLLGAADAGMYRDKHSQKQSARHSTAR